MHAHNPTLRKLRWMLALIVVAVVGACAWFMWPLQLAGQTSYVVTSGTSMNPDIHAGDLAIARKASNYQVGDVVLYHSKQLDRYVLHRLVALQDDGRYVARGDANEFNDPDTPANVDILGKLMVVFPSAGVGVGRILVLASLGLLVFWSAWLLLMPVKPHRRRRGRTSTVVIISMMMLTMPTAASANSSWQAKSVISYEQDVATSIVYPEGKVKSGEPVYLSEVQTLPIRATWNVKPSADTTKGMLRVYLTNEDGWQYPLASSPPVSGAGEDATAVSIELDRMQEIAEAFAARTQSSINSPLQVQVQLDITVTRGSSNELIEHHVSFDFRDSKLVLQKDGPADVLVNAHTFADTQQETAKKRKYPQKGFWPCAGAGHHCVGGFGCILENLYQTIR